MNKIKNKKAQLTVFIILGLFILAGVGIFAYFQSEWYKYKDLPEQFVPVAKYAEQCMEDVALQGIFQAGLNGGHIYPAYEQEEAYLDVGYPVAYWYLAGEDRAVTLQQLQVDLQQYLQEEMKNCLGSFEPFTQFTFTYTEEDIETAVLIGQDTVDITAEVPLQISDGTVTATLPPLQKEVQSSIGNKLFLAYQIMKKENEEGFLEFYTDEIIAASDWLPYEGLDFTCKPKRWTVAEMETYIENAVAVNLQFLRFKGTAYEKVGDPYYDNIYTVDLDTSGVGDLSVRTTYLPTWDMDLEVIPSKDGIVTDIKLVGKTIAIPCIHTYHHKYSAYYPVLFEINDEESAEYPFFFATPVIMNRNEPDRQGTMQPWPSQQDAVRNAAYCSETTTATAYTLEEDGSITTTETTVDTWLYSLDIIAMDSQYSFDGILDNASVSYACGQFSCEIGATDYGTSSSGAFVGYPLLSSSFPSCTNGIVVVSKEGYHPARVVQSVEEDTDGATIQVPMYRLHELTPQLTVIQNHNNVITERGLQEDELAVITLRNDALQFEKVVIYPTGNEDAEGFDKLELLVADDVTYTMDIKLITGEAYSGSFVYNWTPSANAVSAATTAQLYVIKKDVLVATDENYAEAMAYAEEESKNYPPILS